MLRGCQNLEHGQTRSVAFVFDGVERFIGTHPRVDRIELKGDAIGLLQNQIFVDQSLRPHQSRD